MSDTDQFREDKLRSYAADLAIRSLPFAGSRDVYELAEKWFAFLNGNDKLPTDKKTDADPEAASE